MYINAKLQYNSDEGIKGLKEELNPQMLYQDKIMFGPRNLRRVMKEDLILTGLITFHPQKPDAWLLVLHISFSKSHVIRSMHCRHYPQVSFKRKLHPGQKHITQHHFQKLMQVKII